MAGADIAQAQAIRPGDAYPTAGLVGSVIVQGP